MTSGTTDDVEGGISNSPILADTKGEMPNGGEDGGEAIDNRLKYEERKTATREGVAVYKQANRDKSPKVTYSVPAV